MSALAAFAGGVVLGSVLGAIGTAHWLHWALTAAWH